MEQRAHMTRLKNEYNARVLFAKDQHLKKRRAFEDQKLTMLLPSRNNRPRIGTRTTQAYSVRDSVSNVVGDCLADIVDAVDNIGQGLAQNQKFTEEFRVPPAPAFEQLMSNEIAWGKEMQMLNAKLRSSEEERHRSWKKMLKVKNEFSAGLPDMARYGAAPPLRTTTPQDMPYSNRPATGPVYTPVSYKTRVAPTVSAPNSASKYSAARVRQRIASDGTVAPVSEPKKTKEGLYQRPAGRTRKGMEWDAVRGIWIPSTREDFNNVSGE